MHLLHIEGYLNAVQPLMKSWKPSKYDVVGGALITYTTRGCQDGVEECTAVSALSQEEKLKAYSIPVINEWKTDKFVNKST
jgi:hypothetical protein